MINVQDFLDSKARRNMVQVDPEELDAMTFSEVPSMMERTVKDGTFPVVVDNAVWCVSSENNRGEIQWLSHDGTDDIVVALTIKRGAKLSYRFNAGKLNMFSNEELVFKDSPSVYTGAPTEESSAETMVDNSIDASNNIMDEVADTSNDEKERNQMTTTDLNDIMVQASNDIGGSPPADGQLNVFDDVVDTGATEDPGANEKAKETARVEALRKKIKSEISQASATNKIDLSFLGALWSKHAECIAFVTPTDKRQTISAVKVPVKGAQRTLLDVAPEDVKAQFLANPEQVSTSWLKATYTIKARESRPGAPVGVIFRVPTVLKDLTISEFMQDYTTSQAKAAIEGNDNTTAIEIAPMSLFEQKLAMAGSSIKEAVSSAKDNMPGEIKILITHDTSSPGNVDGTMADMGMTFNKKIVRVGHGNKTPLHDRNYLPLVTYKLVDITGHMEEEHVKTLNETLFKGLFTPFQNSKQAGTKHANLIDEQKPYIRRKGEDFESNYVTNNGGDRINLEIAAFYDKNVARGKIEIPLKEKKDKADGTKGAPQFIRYNLTMEDKMAEESYRSQSSLGLPQFAHIVSEVTNFSPELLSASNLRTKFSTKKSGGDKYLSADVARDLMVAKNQGGLSNYDISGFDFS